MYNRPGLHLFSVPSFVIPDTLVSVHALPHLVNPSILHYPPPSSPSPRCPLICGRFLRVRHSPFSCTIVYSWVREYNCIAVPLRRAVVSRSLLSHAHQLSFSIQGTGKAGRGPTSKTSSSALRTAGRADPECAQRWPPKRTHTPTQHLQCYFF